MIGIITHIVVSLSAWLTYADKLAVHKLAAGRSTTVCRRSFLQPVMLLLLMHLGRLLFVAIWLPVVDTLSLWGKLMAE